METLKRKHEEGVEISGGVSCVCGGFSIIGILFLGEGGRQERREGSELFSFFLLFSFSFRAKELIGKSRSCKERGC